MLQYSMFISDLQWMVHRSFIEAFSRGWPRHDRHFYGIRILTVCRLDYFVASFCLFSL